MNELITLMGYIIQDMTEPAGYLPFGIAAGAVFMLFRHLLKRNRFLPCKGAELRKDILLFLIVLYAAVLLKLAFFSREPGSRTDVSLVLFETWGTTIRAHSFFIENILMFIPFGLLIPSAFPSLRRISLCTLTGFSCCLFLELIQLATGRGFCQLDDLVTNTAGVLLGVLLFRFLRRTAERFV
ncbi:VanZ family protein [Mediterraneibacter glycyrrhizinilyticus]|uniref:VanZ family protein n=1 Tax=Mediterraneibacter glycyrrhizinilyticus TaxID=342942 RepID=UPI0019608CE0|nr:VanZ family protein [Mediterraneibacter glycyrrhizinilyticus]MBM6751534.1 VanZ family protein [Mediterraneibacter glycyrrhizinilyticus]